MTYYKNRLLTVQKKLEELDFEAHIIEEKKEVLFKEKDELKEIILKKELDSL